MANVEIERKFLLKSLPEDLDSYPHHEIEQAYLNRKPVVRVRRHGDEYYMTYKGSGMMERTEYNLPLTKEAYLHLSEKADGRVIRKMRYEIPTEDGLTIELDLFRDPEGLILAEVEFESVEQANSFVMPDWFEKDVTDDPAYHNVNMAYGM